MSAFNRAKKFIFPGKNKSTSAGDDFDFDELEGMSDEFDDDHTVSQDRKSTIKSYVKDHYSAKLNDTNERKRLIKASLPASYSGTIDLASDLKDDFDSMRYELGKEWDKQSGSVKKTIKGFESQLKFLRMGKLVDWANNSSSRGSYQEDEVSQNEALVANMMGDFLGAGMPNTKDMQIKQKAAAKENEDVAEYRTKTLNTQLRGAVSSEQMVGELKKLTNYQDQITYIYHKKSLEVQIRSYVEHKTQTELLRTYKDEAVAELKEIHKNTGLPDAVKINQNEFAAQVFKEKMLGNVSNWFDGNTANIRKRVTTRIKDKLLDMTKNFGSSLESFIGATGADDEQGGGGMAKFLFGMGADAALDHPYNKVTNSITGKIRNKIMGNQKIVNTGRRLNALTKNAGMMMNEALVTGETGNSVMDSLMDFFGMRQAAVTKSDKIRGALSENLDTAAYMDIKFKQSVERVIPGWLKLIHKENYLIRTGQKTDKDFKEIEWDWQKEDFTSKESKEKRIMAQVMSREKTIDHSEAYERLLQHFDSYSLSRSTVDKLRTWLFKRVRAGRSITLYQLLLDTDKTFSGTERDEIYIMASVQGGLDQADIEHIDSGLLSEASLTRRPLYAKWLSNLEPLYKQVAGKELIDWKLIHELAARGEEKIFEERGLLIRDEAGNLTRNNDYEKEIFKNNARFEHKKIKHYKEGESRNVVGLDGRRRTDTTWELDEARSDLNWEDRLQDELILENNEANRKMNRWLTMDVLDERDQAHQKAGTKKKAIQQFLMREAEAKKRGLWNSFTRAAGGYIPSFAKGGPTGDDVPVDQEIHAKLHGKEFITDKETTEKNRRLLEFMNKFKAPVVMPDGSVNPIYYKAFGFKTEEEFKNSDTDTRLTREQSRFFRDIKSAGNNEAAYGLVADLFTSLDLTTIPPKELEKLINNRTPVSEKFKIFLELRKKQTAAKNKKPKQDLLGSGISKLRDIVEGNAPKNEKVEKLKASSKKHYEYLKTQILKMSDEQLDTFVNKALSTVDEAMLSNKQMETLTDPNVSSKDKAIMLAKLTLARQDKAQMAKKALSQGLNEVKVQAKGKIKTMINGSETDTTNTDNLKAIANKGKNYVGGKFDALKNLAEEGKLDEKAKALGNKALEKMRADKVVSLGKKFWADQPIDIYITDHLEEPRLTAVGFSEGRYIDEGTGRILETHHDITGPVITKDKSHVLTMADFARGLVDKEGTPIFINSLKRYRNQAKQKAAELYNKYGKKHVNKAADMFLSASEKWQSMFKKTDIDIYIGEGKEPRLTAAGFREGRYISVIKKKPLSGYIDIDGPIMTADGTIIVTTEEISSQVMMDKDGNTIRPPKLMSNMQRLGSLVWNALSFDKAYNVGKKGFNKLKDRYKAWKEKNKKEKEETEELKTQPGKRYGSKLKSTLKRFAGVETGEDGEKSLRIGSWQWKRKKKEEDSWMSKFAGLFGKKDKGEETKKKGMFGKLLGLVGTIAGGVFTLANKIGSIFSSSFLGVAKWLVPKLGSTMFKVAGWLGKPLLTALTFIGSKLGGSLMGRGVMGNGISGLGRMAKIGGLAAGGYMAYQGLKGTEKLDENGQPIIGADGKPETETDWGQAALGAGTMALSTGVGLKTAGSVLMGAGSVARAAVGVLSGPVGWAALGATAAWYGTKWAVGAWKKGKAAKETPLLAFRINQYGFDMTDEAAVPKLMQLEAALQPNLVIQGEKANIKAEIDVESIFGIFGLKYQGGDQEKNKRFLTWFLGRFKPVYLAYIRAVNALKKKTDLSNLDKDLTASQALEVLDKVHFKNQMDLNPYNIKVSPFDDPDETSYDFEDLADKYDDIKEILQEKASSEKPAVAAGAKSEKEAAEKEKEESLTDAVKKGTTLGVGGGIVAGSIWALKKLSKGAGDIFNQVTDSMSKTMGGFVDSLMSKVSSAWDKVKSIGSSVGDSISNGVSTVGGAISSGVSGAWDAGVGAFEKITGKSAEIQKQVYQSFIRAGLSPNQAKAITAEVGRENDYNSNVIFGSHIDPAARGGAAVQNLGMISWNGSRGLALANLLKQRGLMTADGKMVQNQAALDTQTQFAVSEMKGAYAGKLKHFLNNPDADPETFAQELGKNYVVWAYGQDTIAAKGGGRKAFNWQQHDAKRKKYLTSMKDFAGVGTPAQSTGVMKSDAKTGGAAASGAPAGVKSQAANIANSANSAVAAKSTPGAGVLKPGAPAGSAKVVSNSSSTPVAKPAATGGLGGLLARATPELIALGKTHYSLSTSGKTPVTLQGMNDSFMKLFWAMLGEAKQKGLAKVVITEGVRTLAEQQRLYNLYKNGHGALAAYPGKSLHGFGHAMDINTPNADALDKSGLLAKWGFSRPLMKTVKGERTEQWHIENKNIPRNGASPQYPSMNQPKTVTSSSPSTANVTYQDRNGNITKGSGGGSSNSAISGVMNSGGFSSTPNVSASQSNDMSGLTTTNSILNKQLSIQTEIRNTLVELRNHFIQPAGDPKEIDQLKKRNSPENIGSMIGGSVAEALADRLGLNKATEKPKPTAVISASK